ncbi:MAG TPA: cobalamin-dependent protein [bacterium]|nr:cobalamin-dependent protein [bacterium]
MKILLINPWIYDFAAYDFWIRPLGLLYVAAELESDGHTVQLIDCLADYTAAKKFGTHVIRSERIEKPAALVHVPRYYKRYGISIAAFQKQVAQAGKPDYIGITSMMTYWYPGIVEVIRQCRDIYPEVPLVLGGVYATLCAEHSQELFPGVKLVTGRGIGRVHEFFGKQAGKLSGQPDRFFNHMPAYHLYKQPFETAAVITSIGCPFHCSYCAGPLLQPAFEQNSVEAVLAEIKQYVEEHHVADLAFYDDALFVRNEAHVKPILRGIIAAGWQIRFHTPNGLHIRYLDEELAHLLYQAKVRTIRLSFESVDPGRQRDSSSKTTAADLERAVTVLMSAGYTSRDLSAYVLAGLPGQPLAEVQQSIDFVHSLGIPVSLAEYSPVPGTLDFTKALQYEPRLAAEPLLQNCSVFPLSQYDFDDYNAFKTKNADINRKLCAS